MAQSGMDADEVRRLAAQMRAESDALTAVVLAIDALVSRSASVWNGADAHDFAGWWRSQHRPRLVAAGESVGGLAQSAINNADAQDGASGTDGGHGGSSAPAGSGLQSVLSVSRTAGLPWDTNLTVGAHQSWSNLAEKDGSAQGSVGGVPLEGSYSLTAGPSATADESVQLSRNGLDATAAASVGLGVGAAVQGAVGNGVVGARAMASGRVGVDASASRTVHVGLDGMSSTAEVGAFAGAQASASGSAHVSGVEGSATATGYVGVGAHARVVGEVTLTEVKTTVDLGVALGIGGGVKFSVDVKPLDVLSDIQKYRPRW